MRSRAEALAALLVALGMAGCAPTQPTLPASASVYPTTAATPTPAATETARATDTPRPSPTPAVAFPEPGRPWDGATLLREMAASTRPDGVPAQLQTGEVADAVADVVWTVDGAAWDTLAIGGFCGSSTCTLEIAGTHLGRAGEDLWVLEVDPGSGAVQVAGAEVRSLPPDLVEALDVLARKLDAQLPSDAALATARWLPPPSEAGRFGLSYRTGGEEGSCAVDLVLDAVAGTIVEETSTGC